MAELTASAHEVREKFSHYLETAQTRRVLVKKHGEERAYLISVRELHALEETIAILESAELMRELRIGLEQVQKGRSRDAREAFAELEAESKSE